MIEISKQAMADKNYALAGQMAKELAQYVYPKRKAVVHTSDQPLEPMSITVNFVDEPQPFPGTKNLK
ncbi:MAG TPA: hypothetical protein EYO51_04465 [Methylococcaceae bacterium]|nr:hypothetical protein [Methylococcaceae bacterium]